MEVLVQGSVAQKGRAFRALAAKIGSADCLRWMFSAPLALCFLHAPESIASGYVSGPVVSRKFHDFASCKAHLDERHANDVMAFKSASSEPDSGPTKSLETDGVVQTGRREARYDVTRHYPSRTVEDGRVVNNYSFSKSHLRCKGRTLEGEEAKGFSLPTYESTDEPANAEKEEVTMTTGSPGVRTKLTAEQGLKRLLELIRTSRSIEEFTPERLERAFGVPISSASNGADRYGYGGVMAEHWNGGFQVDRARKGGPRFEFGFIPIQTGSSPPMTDICQLDFEHFAAELVAMGFSRESVHDSAPPAPTGRAQLPHGRRMYDGFRGPGPTGLLIEVYPEGEADNPIEKVSHDCVKWIYIYQ